MKLKTFIILSILFCVSGLYGQTNRALIIAIGSYPKEGGWNEIHAANDVLIITPMLKANGYKSENIQILLDDEATKKSIIKGLNSLATQSESGDYIYIHFSGHGQQMWDDNGDEPDGLEESLIPYDAQFKYDKGKYEGENHLRDDEFEIYLDNIRQKITSSGNLVVVLDACYSGTGSREENDDYVRGTRYIFAPDDYEYPEIEPDKVKFAHRQGEQFSPITVFSACQPHEKNKEYKNKKGEYYGFLSFAFCRLMRKSPDQWTNAQFARKLEEKMEKLFIMMNRKKEQTPYFESTDEKAIFRISR